MKLMASNALATFLALRQLSHHNLAKCLRPIATKNYLFSKFYIGWIMTYKISAKNL